MTNLFKDKRLISILLMLAAVSVVAILGLKMFTSQTEELIQLREQLKEMAILREEVLSLRQTIQSVENKKDLSNVRGVMQAIDEIFSSVGLKDKVKTIKSAGRRETIDGIEEDADVLVEKVTMNEMVNIFYRIENAPMILTVKKATVKQSFDNPELLNISIMLSLVKAK